MGQRQCDLGGFEGGKLEHPRPWLGAKWPGLSTGSAAPARAVRHALRRRGSRPQALPARRFDHAALPQSQKSSPTNARGICFPLSQRKVSASSASAERAHERRSVSRRRRVMVRAELPRGSKDGTKK